MHNRTRDLVIEVYLFGQFTPDGRMRQAHMLPRTVPTDVNADLAQQEASA